LFPDLPQGSLKKIELDLLLADLAFKRRNSPLRSGLLLQRGLSRRLFRQLFHCRLIGSP